MGIYLIGPLYSCDSLVANVVGGVLLSPTVVGMSAFLQAAVEGDPTCVNAYFNNKISHVREETIISIQASILQHGDPAFAARAVYKYLSLKVTSPEWSPAHIKIDCISPGSTESLSFRQLLSWLKHLGECRFN